MISDRPGRSAASDPLDLERRADEAADILQRNLVHGGVELPHLPAASRITSDSSNVAQPSLSR